MNYIIWTVPIIKIDQTLSKKIDSSTGEITFNFEGTSNEVLNFPLLYQEDGVSVTVVNNWLIDLKSNRYRKQVNTQVQALLHYFIFLDSVGL